MPMAWSAYVESRNQWTKDRKKENRKAKSILSKRSGGGGGGWGGGGGGGGGAECRMETYYHLKRRKGS